MPGPGVGDRRGLGPGGRGGPGFRKHADDHGRAAQEHLRHAGPGWRFAVVLTGQSQADVLNPLTGPVAVPAVPVP
ncbi:hypothetical protein ETD86_04520 [Nonomuraea turkmeniaca]|uniref:Uncharacterized protein n=1 Tax=Nonomuraea turkmeniaca TaxID=103838 RepID=A0A5S4FUX2_9ACTN|nr:hypothetical protein [Nonomuraea turkmeniaca]TMR24402.1 hypothetical protein ETD86_04520 [Nonomuraea turkmeniaca]